MNPTKIEQKHLDYLLVKGCNSMLEILGSMLSLFTSFLSPSFPFAIYQLIQEKNGCNEIQMT